MWHIQKIDPFRLIDGITFVTFVGGGGKSTLIEHLARSCLARQKTTAITTTTKIFAHEPYRLFDDYLSGVRGAPFIRIGKTVEGGKLTALAFEEIEALGSDFDTVLIEADGAKGRPLKYPARHEPVIAPFSQRVFIVAGLDALFQPFRDAVFRHELFPCETGNEAPRLVYPDVFIRFFSDDALLKGTGNIPRTIVLNKYDSFRHRHIAVMLMKKIMQRTGITEGLITGLKHGVFYRMKYINQVIGHRL